MKRVDIIVIGSGAAGLLAAIEAARSGASVLVLTKGQVGRSGATVTVSGDISVDGRTASRLLGLTGDEADSEETFAEDTVKAGGHINDADLVHDMVTEVGAEVRKLMDAGLKVTGPMLAPGHRYPRGVWASGMKILHILSAQAAAAGVIFGEEFYVTDLISSDDGIAGAAGIDLKTGEPMCVGSKAVVLACGGGMMVFPVQTAPEELVGDGYRMALQAGAELIDMEMIQFLPCCLIDPPIWRGVQFPWLIGPQSNTHCWLLNKHGERFMARYDRERMEMSTRDILSIACAKEVLAGRGGPAGGVFMSWAHLPHNVLDYLAVWYGKPHLRSNWIWEGFDFRPLIEHIKSGYAVEVAPASHFCMGGVLIDRECRTSVPGFFACGEVAGGVHGANRLSGNACSQFLVQGRRAGRAAGAHALRSQAVALPEARWASLRKEILAPVERVGSIAPHELKEKLQKIAGESAGVVRTRKSMEAALTEVRAMGRTDLPNVACTTKERRYNKQWLEALEARSEVVALEAMLVSALDREESRGAHYRDDFPEIDNEHFLGNTILSLRDEGLRVRRRPLDGTHVSCAPAQATGLAVE